MKLEVTMCWLHFLAMQLQPEDYRYAIAKVEYSTPEMEFEGMSGFMETKVTFWIKDLRRFSELFDRSYVFPTDRPKLYGIIKRGELFAIIDAYEGPNK